MNSPSRRVAQQVAALINSRPVSPRVDELEAIIAEVMTCQDTLLRGMTPAPAVLQWHRILAEGDRKSVSGKFTEREWHALLDEQAKLAKQAFAMPIRSWEDVALLGAIAMTYNFAHHDEHDQAEMRKLLAQSDSIGMDQQTIAHLLRAICTMGGFAPGEIPTTREG
jgi:hypothetical protein